MTEKLLVVLLITGVAAPIVTMVVRTLLVRRWPDTFSQDVPALLLAGLVNLLLAASIIHYFSQISFLGLLLAFTVLSTIAHWTYKIVIQPILAVRRGLNS